MQLRMVKIMIKVLFVCHGNVCRSTMAQYILADLVAQAGRADEFEIDSAATTSEEIGNGVYPASRRKLIEKGIECGDHKARKITAKDYDKWDYIIVMDEENIRDVMRIVKGDPDGKVSKLLSWAGKDRDISDPWYTGDFETAYQDILTGCTAFLYAI